MSTQKIKWAKRMPVVIAEKHEFNFQHPEALACRRKVNKPIKIKQRRKLELQKAVGLLPRKWIQIIILLGIMFFLAGRFLTFNQASAGPPIKYETYIVGPEDHSFWEIARKKYPGQEIGSRVHDIRKINGRGGELLSTIIHPGQSILIPAE